jgi:hypothetical protein
MGTPALTRRPFTAPNSSARLTSVASLVTLPGVGGGTVLEDNLLTAESAADTAGFLPLRVNSGLVGAFSAGAEETAFAVLHSRADLNVNTSVDNTARTPVPVLMVMRRNPSSAAEPTLIIFAYTLARGGAGEFSREESGVPALAPDTEPLSLVSGTVLGARVRGSS